MLSKAQNKYIRSLQQQKFRNECKVFIAEGIKIATEWLSSDARINMIVATEEWASEHNALISKHNEAQSYIVKERELAALSGLQAPNHVLLVLPIPHNDAIPNVNDWYIALDDLQDPGNMGTIIRVADWFGIRHLVCSPGSVDPYNPKVVQSAMGSHLRVNIYEHDLAGFLASVSLPKIAATLDGENIYNTARPDAGVLIIGNESKGISRDILKLATKQVTIPAKGGAESLNAAVSAGILCALLLPC